MKTKTILLLIAAIIFGVVGFILLISEPVEGGSFDSLTGFVIMKGMATISFALTAAVWFCIDKSERDNIDRWNNLTF